MRYHEDNNLGPHPISFSLEKCYSSTDYSFSGPEIFTRLSISGTEGLESGSASPEPLNVGGSMSPTGHYKPDSALSPQAGLSAETLGFHLQHLWEFGLRKGNRF